MRFDFEIPTPENCIDCPCKEVRVGYSYGPMKVCCSINPKLDILARDALIKRSDGCPGIVEENSERMV